MLRPRAPRLQVSWGKSTASASPPSTKPRAGRCADLAPGRRWFSPLSAMNLLGLLLILRPQHVTLGPALNPGKHPLGVSVVAGAGISLVGLGSDPFMGNQGTTSPRGN